MTLTALSPDDPPARRGPTLCGSYCWLCWHTHSPEGDYRRCRCNHPLTHHAKESRMTVLSCIRRALHSLYDARPGTCWACRKPWPCATRRRLDKGKPQAGMRHWCAVANYRPRSRRPLHFRPPVARAGLILAPRPETYTHVCRGCRSDEIAAEETA